MHVCMILHVQFGDIKHKRTRRESTDIVVKVHESTDVKRNLTLLVLSPALVSRQGSPPTVTIISLHSTLPKNSPCSSFCDHQLAAI